MPLFCHAALSYMIGYLTGSATYHRFSISLSPLSAVSLHRPFVGPSGVICHKYNVS